MKLEAGGKPCLRKPSAPPAVIAARIPGRVALQRERDDRERRGADQADAGGEAVDAVDQVDDVRHRDDPDHRAELAEVDVTDERQLEQLGRRPGSTPPTNGSVKTSTVTPAVTGMIAAAVCPSSLTSGGRSQRSSIMPTPAITIAPIRIARVWSSQGRKIAPDAQTATRIAMPESFGVGVTCRLRSRGWSIAPIRQAKASATGTSSQAIAAAAAKANSASMDSGI